MIHSERVRDRMEAVGLTQSDLARLVKVTQGAIAKIATKNPNGSSHLHRIARYLETTPAYLEGETDDPKSDAPAPPPAPNYHHVMMAVAMPPERALAAMFTGLLNGLDRSKPVAEQALLLAKRLPNAMSQLRDLAPAPLTAPAADRDGTADPAARATRQPEPIR